MITKHTKSSFIAISTFNFKQSKMGESILILNGLVVFRDWYWVWVKYVRVDLTYVAVYIEMSDVYTKLGYFSKYFDNLVFCLANTFTFYFFIEN